MDFALPEIGEGVYEAELVGWLVKPGDLVKRGQALLEVMTDKATMEIPSPFVGAISAIRCKAGDKIKVGDVVLSYDHVDAAVAAPVKAATAAPKAAPRAPVKVAAGNGMVSHRLPAKAAPSVRLMARQLGIDISTVRGSGPDGRILLEDLTARVSRSASGVKEPQESRPLPYYGKAGTRLKLHGLRRRIAEQMARSKRIIPHYTYVEECDVSDLVRLRYSLRDVFASSGVKLTYLPFFVKAVAAAMREVPLANSSLDEESGDIVMHDTYHVGVAVATPTGLVVPVVRDADKKDVSTIAREIERLSREARMGRARLEDLKGGTFTITSVGSIGGFITTPVVNHPEVGILGLGRVIKRPIYDDQGRIKPADLIYLSLSFDHRVVDGAVGAHFANVVVRQIQSPAMLLLPHKP